jgi:ParB-like chromosome segregation protein Spo0J
MMAKQKTQPEHISELRPDPKNARKHNPRNIGMIANSLQEVGAARSIVIDENNNILAGNGTVEAAAQAGIEKVMVVEADGNTLVAVKRTGLTKKQKTRLAIADNRTAELAVWDVDNLRDYADEGVLDGLFSENELDALLQIRGSDDSNEISYKSVYEIVVECADEKNQEQIYNKLIADGLKCRVLTL